MIPFFKPPADAWPVVAMALPKPWPMEAIRMDLAWHEGEIRAGRRQWRKTTGRIDGVEVPVWYACDTVSEMAFRWGVSRYRAAEIMRDLFRVRQDPDGIQTEIRQESDEISAPPRDHAPEIRRKSDGNQTEIRRDSDRARVQEEERRKKKEDLARAARRVWEVWQGIELASGEQPHSSSRKLREAHAGNLRARITEHGEEACALVVRYVHDPAAGWWYDKRAWDVGTLFRPKHFDELLTRAKRWQGVSGDDPRWSRVLWLSQQPKASHREHVPGDDFSARCDRSAAGQIVDARSMRDSAERIGKIREEWKRRVASGVW